jgi:hypothetical protein
LFFLVLDMDFDLTAALSKTSVTDEEVTSEIENKVAHTSKLPVVKISTLMLTTRYVIKK